jgi:hypothetical protein
MLAGDRIYKVRKRESESKKKEEEEDTCWRVTVW